MLFAIAIIFALVWALGLVTAITAGGYVHVLAVVSVALLAAGAYQAGMRVERRRGTACSPPPGPSATSADAATDTCAPSPEP